VRPRSRMSGFTTWLRKNGFERLAPADDRPRPLCSRIALLQSSGASDADVRLLCEVWERWRVSVPRGGYGSRLMRPRIGRTTGAGG